jgi:dTDP-4-dehydrorhamnose reductase
MKLLVIGGSGLVGYKIAEQARDNYTTWATYNRRPITLEGCKPVQLDKCDRKATFALVLEITPDLVIDTAALHDVNYCETHRDAAWRVNVEGTRNVAEACHAVGAKMIFTSTDYVFDGVHGSYREEDPPMPINYYGRTKLEAERIVTSAGIDYIVARPSVIYGWNPGEAHGVKSSSGKSMNFALWALGKLRRGEALRIVADQYSSPTLADSLAEVLLTAGASDASGLYHIAGKGCIDRYTFTKALAKTFEVDATRITPVTSDAFPQVAKRPMRCCLDVGKAEREFQVTLLSPTEGLQRMRDTAPPLLPDASGRV